MQPEGSLPHTEEPATCPYPERCAYRIFWYVPERPDNFQSSLCYSKRVEIIKFQILHLITR